MSVDWQWQEMTWYRTITPAAAGAGLERLATAVELGPVVLELRVGAEGAHWLVGTEGEVISVTKNNGIFSHDIRMPTSITSACHTT